jgi:hypothetical protein
MHTAKRCFLPTKNRICRLPKKSLASGILIQHQEALWATRRCLNYFLQLWNLENHCMRAVTGLKGIEAYILLMHCVKHSSNFLESHSNQTIKPPLFEKASYTYSAGARGTFCLLAMCLLHLL